MKGLHIQPTEGQATVRIATNQTAAISATISRCAAIGSAAIGLRPARAATFKRGLHLCPLLLIHCPHLCKRFR